MISLLISQGGHEDYDDLTWK